MVNIGGRLAGMNDPGAYQRAHEGLLLGGRYRLVAPIGAGGMAVVWQGYDEVLGRAVAVKLLAPSQIVDVRARERIRREARAAAALSHPNIAQVHDYGETGLAGRVLPYVVMELVPGGTLSARLSAGALAPRFAMRTGAEIAAALAAAHAEGLVHRDIKPGNVMLAPTGAKVVDFGIAAAVAPDGSGASDDPDEVLGTPAYLAPERLVGDAVVPASDVYALGVVLYRMLSGRSPWSSEDTRQMVRAHLYVPPAPLPPVVDVPEYVVRLCDRCLAKNPAHRPSAEEAAAVLAHGAGLRVVVDEPLPVGEVTVVIRPAPAPAPGAPAPSPPAAVPSSPVGPPSGSVSSSPVGPPSGSVSSSPVGPPSASVSSSPAGRSLASVASVASSASGAQSPASPAAYGPPAGTAASSRRRVVAVTAAGVVLAAAGAAAWILADRPADVVSGANGGAGASAPVPSVTPAAAPDATTGAGPVATAPGAKPDRSRPASAPSRQQLPSPGAATPTVTTTRPTPSPTPTATPAPVRRTLSSEGGTVVATCPDAVTAELLSWTATRPYKVQSADPGPAAAPAVTFKHGTDLITMTVTCDGGIPAADIAQA
ncbi:serine/threonine protein kinase [Actinoplanes philippinensis]|uniref:non-specific serine/threonine protein kinase n=2 Tax=Actinoplanes philippinensis TaxID=35752 RepID=A0A1I2M0K2_9ACTN|nr:serine/threonine protein kinase [Actinoplanes philippinensis]